MKFHGNANETIDKLHAVDSRSSTSKKVVDETPATTAQLPKRNELQFHPKKRDNSIYHASLPICMNREHLFFRPVNSDVHFDSDCQDDPHHQISNTQTTVFDNIRFHTPTSSPAQSEGTEMTGWDEWDEASDMLSHIDPITACNERVKIYSSLV